MSTLTDKLPTVKLPTVKLPEVKIVDLDEAKKPLFAAVGVVDLSVEQVKDLPAEAKKVQAKVEAARVARTVERMPPPARAMCSYGTPFRRASNSLLRLPA